MKGFPNQIADFRKLADGMRAIQDLVDRGEKAKDDGVYGEALVRAGVAGTGHTPMPVDAYIRQQLAKRPSHQSFRTTARGLRELYRLLGFIDDSGPQVVLTAAGREAAAFSARPMDAVQVDFWRGTVRDIMHDGGDGESSHPYQVLLRLVGQRPGISRDKCALALEARNDSLEELARIVGLSDLPETEIIQRIGVTQANWDNAKKMLPKFAEELEDVLVTMQGGSRTYRLADAPGRAERGAPVVPASAQTPSGGRQQSGARAPRSSRLVTPDTIARAGAATTFDEVRTRPNIDPQAAAEAARVTAERFRRHQAVVQRLASLLARAGAELHADPFDILALFETLGLLIEVKTLDGTLIDERARVMEALSQLLYYEAFVTTPLSGEAPIRKIACFESPISDAHRFFLNQCGIAVIWEVEGGFAGDDLPVVLR